MNQFTVQKDSSIFVAGHHGLAGSAICRALDARGYVAVSGATSAELDLRVEQDVDEYIAENRPQVVILAAAKVGGIHANNSRPAEFIRENLAIQTNVIHSAWKHGVKKLVFLGSSCIYPKLAAQPMTEDCLLTGSLEPTNEWYAIAKIAGIKMCQAYRRQYGFDAISLMPTNLYGQGDNFHLKNSHVLPALIRKFHEARVENRPSVELWGSGTPRREFLHVDDLGDAVVHLLERYSGEQIVNVGWGRDISIRELAELIRGIVGYTGELTFNPDMPDGAPQKLLDVSRLNDLGWRAQIELGDGITRTYAWFVENQDRFRSI